MAGIIYVDQENVNADAARLESAAAYLEKVSLVPQDMRTTLPANENSKNAYEKSQDRLERLGRLLDQEARNIRELGLAFAEFDEMMGRLGENGSRHPSIIAKK